MSAKYPFEDHDLESLRARVQTTDATQTDALSVFVAPGVSAEIDVQVWGRSAAGDVSFHHRRARAYRGESVNLAAAGVSVALMPDFKSDATWGTPDIAVDDTAQTIIVRVTGKAATTIEWRVRAEVVKG